MPIISNFNEIENYISNIPKFVKESDTAITKAIAGKLLEQGEKQNYCPQFIHVAGTNGKGSVCTYVESILMEAGYSVGKFVSPHLVDIRERIICNKTLISKYKFAECFNNIQTILDEGFKGYNPNYFEMFLLVALEYYIDEKPDFIILETGLGGKLDQTNYVTDNKIAVITEIGMDHMAYLGDTYEKIASEKAGIIKPKNQVVYVSKRQECNEIIEKAISMNNAIGMSVEKAGISNVIFDVNTGKMQFDYFSKNMGKIENITLNTIASYQCENAAVAIEVVGAINRLMENKIPKETIISGLQKAFWPGRMEYLETGVYIDGAHNVDGIEAFTNTLNNVFGAKNCYLLFGVVADKEYEKMIRLLIETKCIRKIIVAKLETDRSTNLDQLRQTFEKISNELKENHVDFIPEIIFTDSVKKGYELLLEHKMSEDLDNSAFFAVGSLYLVGQIKEL